MGVLSWLKTKAVAAVAYDLADWRDAGAEYYRSLKIALMVIVLWRLGAVAGFW